MSEVNLYQTCKRCAHQGPHVFTLRTSGVHYGDLRCAECNTHLGFPPKPESDPTKYKRPSKHRDLVREYSKGFCEMCLRSEGELPKGTTLEAQHVQEYQDGGDSTRENIWIVCTACHRMVHWVRTYHGGNHVQPIIENLAQELAR